MSGIRDIGSMQPIWRVRPTDGKEEKRKPLKQKKSGNTRSDQSDPRVDDDDQHHIDEYA